MQLNEAVQLVQQKFNEEAQGNIEGEVLTKWQEAHDKFPVIMDIATQILADQIIAHNQAAARQMMQQQAAQQGQQPDAPAAQ